MGSNLLRVQVAHWRRWLLPLAISMTSLFGAQVSAQCWGGTCNPPSAHSVDWCQMVQGGRLVMPTAPWSAIAASSRQLLNVLVRESGT